jgi:hypothetical protein
MASPAAERINIILCVLASERAESELSASAIYALVLFYSRQSSASAAIVKVT